MAGHKKQEALVGIGQLEKLAGAYEKTSRTLRQLAKGLRGVMVATEGQEAVGAPGKKRKGRKKMSAEARARISQAAKERWAAKKGAGNGKEKVA